MQIAVKIFKNRLAELGDPNKVLFVVKLVSPTFSSGIRKKIIMIKKILINAPRTFNIDLIYLGDLIILNIEQEDYNYSVISNTSLNILFTLLPESIVSNGSFLKRWRKHKVIMA